VAHRSRRTLPRRRKTKRIVNVNRLLLPTPVVPFSTAATIVFDDMEASVTPPGGYLEPQPLTLGPNWLPNDVRLQLVSASEAPPKGWSEAVQMVPDPPTGFVADYNLNPTPGFETEGVYHRYLQPGDQDTSVAWIKPAGWRHWCWSLLTARGVDPATTPTAGSFTLSIAHTVGNSFCTVGPVTVPGPGVMVFCLGTLADPEGLWPSWATSVGCPTGWKNLVATDKSGQNYYAYDTSPAFAVVGQKFTTAGTTGTVTFPIDPGSHAFTGMWVFLKAAPPGISTGGAILETASVGASSSSSATNPHSFGGQIVATDSVSTAFNPLIGYIIPDPYALTGDPVSASVVAWNAVTPAGSTATVETSINNGLSWDPATNGGPIPRLREGDTTTRTVLSRVTFTRQSALGGAPYLTYLKVQPYTKISSDELIPTFYGQVDKTTTKITSGSSGGTGGGSSGAGVSASGGGMFGDGAVMKIHATDPSRLIKLAQWENAFVGPTNVTYPELGKAMVLDRRPNQTLFNQVGSNLQVPSSLLVWGLNRGASDPYQDIRGVFTAIGHECGFGVTGSFDSHPVPDPRRGPVTWDFDHTVNPCIIGAESELDTSLICNGYVIIGQSSSSGNPVTAFAYDTDTASKYNIFPPPIGIGKRIQTLTFSTIQIQQQCQDIADALLFNSLGLANTVTIGIVPHPGIALGDVARINSPETGVVGRFLIQGYTLPDGQAQQQLTCFRQTDNPN